MGKKDNNIEAIIENKQQALHIGTPTQTHSQEINNQHLGLNGPTLPHASRPPDWIGQVHSPPFIKPAHDKLSRDNEEYMDAQEDGHSITEDSDMEYVDDTPGFNQV